MLERWIILQTIDEKWKDHLYEMDALREGVGLQAYGQKDPLIVYKKEAYLMFQDLLYDVNKTVISTLWRAKISEDNPIEQTDSRQQAVREVHESSTNMGFASVGGKTDIQRGAEAHRNVKVQPIKVEKKPGRNDPSPCGSGKKYKHCHGKNV
jgi:preprotein translocase subunit SecA